MKKIILIISSFFSIVYIANAIPVPALIIGGDFLLLAIPSILTVFSFLYFYFKKYIFYMNVFLFIFSFLLYFIHLEVTGENLIFSYEFSFFICFGFYLIFKLEKFNKINYLIIFLLIFVNFFLIKIDYNLYQFRQIYSKLEKNLYYNIKITKVIYKDNFISIYYYDIETGKEAYTVIGKGIGVSKCVKKGDYNICNGGDNWLGKGVSGLVYKIID